MKKNCFINKRLFFWLTTLVVCVLFWSMVQRCFAADEIVEFPEKDIKITFDPSPDPRATGHSLYWTSMVTNEGIKTDLKKETVYIIPKGTFVVGHAYKLTATAYGLVDGKEAESAHSEPLHVRLIQEDNDPDDPGLIKPGPPRLVEVRWEQE